MQDYYDRSRLILLWNLNRRGKVEPSVDQGSGLLLASLTQVCYIHCASVWNPQQGPKAYTNVSRYKDVVHSKVTVDGPFVMHNVNAVKVGDRVKKRLEMPSRKPPAGMKWFEETGYTVFYELPKGDLCRRRRSVVRRIIRQQLVIKNDVIIVCR